jgi:hypothetical protein
MGKNEPVVVIRDKVSLEDLVQMSQDEERGIFEAVECYVTKELLPKYRLTEDDMDLIESSVIVEIKVTTTVPWPGPIEKKEG